MSVSVQQVLSDARRLSARMREHDAAADGLIASSQDLLKGVEAMKEYHDDVEGLNAIAHNRPRAQLVLGIQQENRHIRQLQHENKELRAALEESQNAVELIMSKYRQHVNFLVNTTKLDKNLINYKRTRMLQEKTDKICDMARVMKTAIQWDNEASVVQKENLTRLLTENKGLRDMLEISRRNGSASNPIARPKLVSRECQTDEVLGDPTTSKMFDDGQRASKAAKPSAVDESGAGDAGNQSRDSSGSGLPCSPLSRTFAVSPSHARPLSSASSAGGASDASSPASSVIMGSAWQDDEGSSLPSSPAPSSNGESSHSVRANERRSIGSSESEESDDEVTFNTIKRGATISKAVAVQAVSEPTVEVKKVNGVKHLGTSGEQGANGVHVDRCNSKVSEREDDGTSASDTHGGDAGHKGLVNGEIDTGETPGDPKRQSSPEKNVLDGESDKTMVAEDHADEKGSSQVQAVQQTAEENVADSS